MNKRPELNQVLDETTFRSFYYLKEELSAFCRENGLPVSGSKIELTDRIAQYLSTGERLPANVSRKVKTDIGPLTLTTQIEPNFVCSEKHRKFFKDHLGKRFSFNVAFQKWLKANTGKPYAHAIEAYQQILEEKKQGTSVIDKQFEYNTYIRDFFEDNPGKTLQQAIICWNYKKAVQGHNRYERSDLSALR